MIAYRLSKIILVKVFYVALLLSIGTDKDIEIEFINKRASDSLWVFQIKNRSNDDIIISFDNLVVEGWDSTGITPFGFPSISGNNYSFIHCWPKGKWVGEAEIERDLYLDYFDTFYIVPTKDSMELEIIIDYYPDIIKSYAQSLEFFFQLFYSEYDIFTFPMLDHQEVLSDNMVSISLKDVEFRQRLKFQNLKPKNMLISKVLNRKISVTFRL